MGLSRVAALRLSTKHSGKNKNEDDLKKLREEGAEEAGMPWRSYDRKWRGQEWPNPSWFLFVRLDTHI